MFASRYARRHLAEPLAAGVAGTLTLPAGALETSLWLRKAGPPMTDM